MAKDRLADLVAAQLDNKDEKLRMPDTMCKQRDFLTSFFAQVEKIRAMIDKIQTNVEEVKLKHSTILSEPHTDEKIKMELKSLMADIKATANKVREELIDIRLGMIELNMEPKIYMNESTLVRMHEIQHSTLFAKFFHVMMEYNRAQIDYRERCKGRIQEQLQIVTDTKEAKQTLADIEARHVDIVNLENSIKEVYEMFGGMAMVIGSQGETIVRIQEYVNHSVDSVESAMKETYGIQSAARRKKIMIVVCLAVVAFILVSTIAGY